MGHIAKCHQVWLISATPRIVGSVIAERLGLTGALGTEFVTTDGVFEGGFEGEVLHGDEKAVAANKLVTRLGASLADCWTYSDSRNDIPLLTMVGHREVVNPDARLAAPAKKLQWPILQLKRASIMDAQRRVRREAKASKAALPKPVTPRTGRLKEVGSDKKIDTDKKKAPDQSV